MKNWNRWLLSGAVAIGVALLVAAPVAQAAGFGIFEAGAKATGMGGAYVAVADDGSSMFYNPAGLASNDKFYVSVGDTLIAPQSKFYGDNPYPGAGTTASQQRQIFFPPNFFVAVPVSKGVNVAFGTWFPNGLSTSWQNPDTFAGRFLSQRVDLRQYAFGLQLSAQLADWLSVGAGPELRVSDVKLQRNAAAYNMFTGRFVDVAHLNLVGDSFATGVTWGAGIQIKPTQELSIGASYHNKIDQKYTGKATLYQISTGNPYLDGAVAATYPLNTPVPAETTLQYPSIAQFGIGYKVSSCFTVSAAAVWTGWDVFNQTVFSFSSVNGKQIPAETLVHNWKNAWSYRFGVDYQATPKLNLLAGIVYDQTPQPDADVSPLLPDANRTGYSIGLGYKIGKATTVELSNLFLFFHDRSTNGAQVDGFNGTYKTFADLLVLNLKTSF